MCCKSYILHLRFSWQDQRLGPKLFFWDELRYLWKLWLRGFWLIRLCISCKLIGLRWLNLEAHQIIWNIPSALGCPEKKNRKFFYRSTSPSKVDKFLPKFTYKHMCARNFAVTHATFGCIYTLTKNFCSIFDKYIHRIK